MYSEWASLQHDIRSDTSNKSVLSSFPEAVGNEVANAVVKNLAQNLSIGAISGEPSTLTTDKQVKWTMEVSKTVANLLPWVYRQYQPVLDRGSPTLSALNRNLS